VSELRRVSRHWRRWQLACRRPGHPWEIAVITQGTLLWPYFTVARLIAPYVVDGKGQEYKPEWGAAILALLLVSLMVTAFNCRGCSSWNRRAWMQNAAFIGLIGVVERIFFSSASLGVVRE